MGAGWEVVEGKVVAISWQKKNTPGLRKTGDGRLRSTTKRGRKIDAKVAAVLETKTRGNERAP